MLAKSQTRKPWVKAAGAAMLLVGVFALQRVANSTEGATKIPPPAQDEPVGATHVGDGGVRRRLLLGRAGRVPACAAA